MQWIVDVRPWKVWMREHMHKLIPLNGVLRYIRGSLLCYIL